MAGEPKAFQSDAFQNDAFQTGDVAGAVQTEPLQGFAFRDFARPPVGAARKKDA